jgi:hypothetical protein
LASYRAYVLSHAAGHPLKVFLVKMTEGFDVEVINDAGTAALEGYNQFLVGVDLEVTTPEDLKKRIKALNPRTRTKKPPK